MKRLIYTLAFLSSISSTLLADGRGVPFFNNYDANEYHAHNRNYDIATDNYGTVFVANFEGLIYFDGSSWRKIHTPGISRVTRLACGENGRIWVGGYNVFGYLEADECGRLQLHTIISDAQTSAFSEVDLIKADGSKVFVHTTEGKSYRVTENNTLEEIFSNTSDFFAAASDSINHLQLTDKVTLSYSRTSGLLFEGALAWASLSEKDGLVSNTINYVTYNKEQIVWGATDRGIFSVEVLSPYGQMGELQGLKGEVNTIVEHDGYIYIGTMEGLFRLKDNHVENVGNISYSCWQLQTLSKNQLLAATSDGLYLVDKDEVKQLSVSNTLSVTIPNDGRYITGEMDGVFCIDAQGTRTRLYSLEKATSLKLEEDKIIAETIYGEQWSFDMDGSNAKCIRRQSEIGKPKLSYTDANDRLWITDPDGQNLRIVNPQTDDKLPAWVNAYNNYKLNAICFSSDNKLWIGGDFGLRILDAEYIKTRNPLPAQPPLIRQITVMSDSVLWGGYSHGTMEPRSEITNIKLPSSCHNVVVNFSTKTSSITHPTTYRYRVNGGRWSNWSDEAFVRFNNVSWGRTNLELQALDLFGRESEISQVRWDIAYPFYLQWYAFLLYLIILVGIIAQFFRMHTAKLARDKQRLEAIVTERTSELKKSYEEQQKISATLATTLDDLKRTQNDLVRMERSATAGKLTQGLIDRILNPINYINNFSILTSGLAQDLRNDIEDEQENISEDNYDDCQDLLDMMTMNLKKIEEHGNNTTRTLRAMESILNNHTGALVSTDLVKIVRQAVNVTNERTKKENDTNCDIEVKLISNEEAIIAKIDPIAVNKMVQSLLTNSIYAVLKKYSTAPYVPEINVTLADGENDVKINIHDNGIGIENTIIEKIFDPFFTTKPTAEAAGVGLYLVRELVNDHNGKIAVESVKNEYCDFIITLPKVQTKS